jgi:hypothetical protein
MLQKLLNLLGTSVDTQKIIDLYAEFGAVYPKKITGNANISMLKGKVEKDGIALHFGVCDNGKHLNPKKTKKQGTYIALLLMIEITKNYKGEIPLGIKYTMHPNELTQLLGSPKEIDFMGKSFIWKKNISTQHEIKIDDSRGMNEIEPFTRSIMLQYIWEEE